METITLDQDIRVFYIQAESFPGGIMDANQKLHELVPFSKDREYYGISRPEGGPIIYRAAATELFPGEAAKLNCETLVLPKGKYVCLTLPNYREQIPAIEGAFKEILALPGLDPNGYCVEWYLHDSASGLPDRDVKCMVRLVD